MNVLTFVALAAVARGTSICEIALDSFGLIGTAVLLAKIAQEIKPAKAVRVVSKTIRGH